MANNNNVRVDVNVTSNGTTAAETKEAAKLHNELNNVAKAATRVSKATAAARQGVKRASGEEGPEFRDSGRARGIGNQTGAGGRDFAKQAQGLGGLVHVYATFAANLFAVGAAFGALQRAADVTNMVKGLDQLGAASGRNLGTLSKQLAAVTDGAISLQDAMTATAQATAGGMSSENLLRLGKVARSASQALGIDMPNAVSRLSRGITKIEPELLDEIGIMVRVDKAAQDYARTIGKTATSLTDFERRQAFANAVLTQGEEKFGAIEMAANPYQKILASIQNLTQAGLELVNKALGPLLNVLSQSPVALGATLLGITGILLKQALPAITQFKEGLADSAKKSAELATSVAKRRVSAFEFRNDDIMAANAAIIRDTKKTVEKLKAEYIDLAKTQTVGKNVKSTLNSGDIFSEEGSKHAIKRLSDIDKALEAHTNKSKELSDKRIAELTREKGMLSSIPGVIQANLKAQKVIEAEDAKTDAARATGAFSSVALNEKALKNLQRKALNSSVVSNAAENAATYGLGASLKMVREEIKAAEAGFDAMGKKLEGGPQKFNMLSRSLLTVRAGLAAVTSYAMLAASALNNVFMIVGIAVATFQALDFALSKNSREMEAFNSALETTKAGIDNLDRTVDGINKKPLLGQISTESIEARATAILELSTSMETLLSKFQKQDIMASWWDKMWDGIKGGFGGGALNNMLKEQALSITKIISSMRDGAEKTATVEKVSGTLGINPSEVTDLVKVLEALKIKGIPALDATAEELKKYGTEASNVASKSKALDNAIKDSSKVFSDIMTSAIPTDPLAKLGMSFLNVGKTMQEAFEDPTTKMSQLVKLTNDFDSLKLVNVGGNAKEVMKFGKELKTVAENVELAEKGVKAYEKILANATDESNAAKALTRNFGTNNSEINGRIAEQQGIIDAAQTAIDNFQILLANNTTRYLQISKKIEGELFKSFSAGASLIENSIGQGFAKAQLTVSKFFADSVSGTGGDLAKIDLQKQELSLQLANINTMVQLIKANNDLKLSYDEGNLLEREATTRAKIANKELDPQIGAQLLKSIGNQLAGIFAIREGRYTGASGARNIQNDRRLEDKDSNGALRAAAQMATPGMQAEMAQKAKAAEIAANLKTLDLQEKQKKAERVKYDLLIKQNEQTTISNKLELDTLNFKSQGSRFLTEDQVRIKQSLETSIALSTQEKERLDINKEQDRIKELSNRADETKDTKMKEAAIIAQEDLEVKKKTVGLNNTATNALRDQAQVAEIIKRSFDEQLATLEDRDKLLRINTVRVQAQLDIEEDLLETRKKLNTITGSNAVAADTALAIKKLDAAFKTKSEELLLTKDRNLATLGVKYSKDTQNPDYLKQKEAEESGYKVQLAAEQSVLDVRKHSLTVIGQQLEMLEKQKDLIESIDSLSTSLAGAFGNVGSAIGSAIKGLTEFANREESHLQTTATLRAQIENSQSDPKDKRIAQEELSKAERKYTTSQLQGLASVAGSSKKIFKEKTAAYKVLDAVEKATHIETLARMAQQAATWLAQIPTLIAGGVSKLFAQGGWAGFAGATAFLGLMASLGFGGGKSVPKPGFTAEDRQKTQGTGGQGYDAKGNIIATGGGVLGEITTKSESVANSIAMMEKTGFKNLDFSNKMLEALIAIRENTKGLAKSIITSIPDILRQNPSSSGGNFLTGKTTESTLDKGINISGTIGQLLSGKGSLGQYRNTKSSNSGFLGFIGGSTSFNTERGKLDDKDGAISKAVAATVAASTQALTESSKKIGVTISEEFLNGFDIGLGDISSMGLTGEEFAKAIEGQIGIGMDKVIESIFPTIQEFSKLGESALQTYIRLGRNIELFDQSLQLTGSTYTKLVESTTRVTPELTSAVENAQKAVDVAKTNAKVAETTVTEWKKVGESFGESGGEIMDWVTTVVSSESATSALAIANNNLTIAQNALNDAAKLTTTNNIAAKNALVELAGGQEKFVESTQYFFSNFKTEAQRFDINSKAVTDRMTELGQSSVDTKEEFNSLIMSLDLSQASAQKLWVDLMAIAPAFNDIAEATSKFNSELEDMNVRLLQMTGSTDLAQQISRDKIRKQLADKLGGSELLAMQEQIWVQEDLSKTRKLDIELLQTQGRTYDALLLQREEELRVMTEAERTIKKQIYEAQDAQKFRKLDIELTKAQGRGYDAMLATREDELKGLSENEKVLRKLIWAEEDRDKTINLELGLMEAMGMSYEALLIKRERDLGNMSVEDGLIQRKINTAVDYAKTQSLEIDLLEAQGNTQQALTARRTLELRGMKASDAELKSRIWLLEDEKKLLDAKTSQEIRIYELLGQSSEALRLTRAKELKDMDPQLVASQLYIYALEDEADIKSKLKDAYDRETNTIKTTISATRDFIKILKDYKNALLLSDKSILTPAQKYAEAKRQFLQITAVATSTAITDAQKEAQAEAISKIPSAGDAFLEASRTLYASSEAYTTDFSYVLSILDSTNAGLEKQQSSAEKSLTLLQSQTDYQKLMSEDLETSAQLLVKLVAAAEATATARDAAALGGSAAAGGVFTAPTGTGVSGGVRSAIVDSGSRMILGTGGWSGSFEAAQKLITDSVSQVDAGTMSAADLIAAIRRQGVSGAQLDTILGVSPGTSSAWALAHGIPGFARGGVANGVSLVGEMGPELVNFNNPSRVHSNRETRDLFNTAELVNEIRALREEVAQLRNEQREQTGHLIQTNYDANAKAAEKVAAANADAANASTWANRSMPKLA